LENTKPVALNEKVPFHCKLCGGCCRYVADSIMLEPMDAYRLARHLRDQGEPVTGIEDVLAQYSHAAWLADSLPIFLLDTVGSLDVCVFLKAGRCSVYEAHPPYLPALSVYCRSRQQGQGISISPMYGEAPPL